jgi:hypothetical protein
MIFLFLSGCLERLPLVGMDVGEDVRSQSKREKRGDSCATCLYLLSSFFSQLCCGDLSGLLVRNENWPGICDKPNIGPGSGTMWAGWAATNRA